MIAVHVNSEIGISRKKRDDVTSCQVKNSTYVHGTRSCRRLNHGDDSVVYTNIDSSLSATIDLQVNIVPSSGRHSQFSILVLHAACEMAERGTDRPVFDH